LGKRSARAPVGGAGAASAAPLGYGSCAAPELGARGLGTRGLPRMAGGAARMWRCAGRHAPARRERWRVRGAGARTTSGTGRATRGGNCWAAWRRVRQPGLVTGLRGVRARRARGERVGCRRRRRGPGRAGGTGGGRCRRRWRHAGGIGQRRRRRSWRAGPPGPRRSPRREPGRRVAAGRRAALGGSYRPFELVSVLQRSVQGFYAVMGRHPRIVGTAQYQVPELTTDPRQEWGAAP